MCPIYEYSCPQCKKVYELIHKHDEHPKAVCDECLTKLEKQISLGGFRLNGDGWTSRGSS